MDNKCRNTGPESIERDWQVNAFWAGFAEVIFT